VFRHPSATVLHGVTAGCYDRMWKVGSPAPLGTPVGEQESKRIPPVDSSLA